MVDGVLRRCCEDSRSARVHCVVLKQVVQKLGSSSLSTRETAAGQALPQRRMKYKLQLFTADQARLTRTMCRPDTPAESGAHVSGPSSMAWLTSKTSSAWTSADPKSATCRRSLCCSKALSRCQLEYFQNVKRSPNKSLGPPVWLSDSLCDQNSSLDL